MLRITLGFMLFASAPPEESEPAAAATSAEAPAEATPQELTGPAYAEELELLPQKKQSKDKAIQIFESGSTAYAEGRFEEAIEFFSEAYRTFPSPGLLFSLGQSHRSIYALSNDTRQRRFAILRYSQYLRVAPEGDRASDASRSMSTLLAQSELGAVDEKKVITRVMISTPAEDAWMRIDGGEQGPAPGVETVDPGEHTIVVGGPGYIESQQTVDVPEGATVQLGFGLSALPARIMVTGPRGAEVAIDGRRIGNLPLSKTVDVEPGVHFIAVTRNGHVAYTRQFEVGRNEDLAIDAEMRNSTQRVMSYAMVGLGGAGVITSGVMMGLAFAAQNRAMSIDEEIDMGNASENRYATYLDEVDKRDQFRTVSIASGAAGAGLLLTGVVLFVFDRPQVDVPLFDRERRAKPGGEGPSLSAAPILSPRTVGATASIRF